jgi:hypothetical protein
MFFFKADVYPALISDLLFLYDNSTREYLYDEILINSKQIIASYIDFFNVGVGW